MQARIKSLHLENFKGVKSADGKREATYNFEGKNVSVMGANATGKTTIADSLWWLLFNKDSQGNEKFSIRPLEKDGKQIDNVEICVSAVLDIDGKEMKLKKVQKQKWVTKRGTSDTELKGNENSYSVDDYPKNEKEYKECVAGIVGEDLFKILTSPTYFPNMKWQEQGEILMRFVTDISDVELAKQDKRFAGLISELEKAPSTDDIKKKYQKALSEWKKRQAELPVRIDEAEKQKVDIDVAELELLKNSLNEQIAENKEKQEDISKEFEEQQKASDGLLELQFKLTDLEKEANADLFKQKKELQSQIDEKNEYLLNISNGIQRNNREIAGYEQDIEGGEKERKRLLEKWNAVNEEIFDENTAICPTCHRELPSDERERLLSTFEKSKDERIAAINKKGLEIRADIENAQEMIPKLQECNKDNLANKEKLEKEVADLEKKLSELPDSIDISDRQEVQEIQRQIAEKEAAMRKGNSAEGIRQQLKSEAEELQNQMDAAKERFVLVKKNDEADDRIAELQKEQREVAQLVANQERMLFLLEEFIRYKMDSVSETINSRFEMVNFILFRNQINGGLAETCECEYGGVPYASLNSAAKIQCGLDIIRTLQKFHGVYCPVFVDNRESCTEIPKMDCQVISLYVEPSCKELKIEMEG